VVDGFTSVFVIPTFDHATIDRLNKVHIEKTKRQDFAINFEVWVYILFCYLKKKFHVIAYNT
jgi:hypothetical protein